MNREKEKSLEPQRLIRRFFNCPECGNNKFIEDSEVGEVTCQTCGAVVSENKLTTAPEWRAFTKEEYEQRSRTGSPISFSIHDKGLSTVIEQVGRDAYGKSIPANRRLEMLRLRKWHKRAQPSVDRNLIQAMAELDRLSDRLHIPSHIKERAAVIYRKALDAGLVKGRSIAAIAASSLYAACRSSETPRTLKEVSKASGIHLKDVSRCYRLLLKELDMRMPIEDPLKCVSKIASKVNVSAKTQRVCLDIIREAKRRGLSVGKDPMGLAAAALYVACVQEGDKKTQRDIADAANVTEVTVRNRYKNLKNLI